MNTCLSFCIALFFIAYMLPAQCPDGSPDAGYTCIPDMEFEEELVLKGIDTDGVIDGQGSSLKLC
ncbi:hypothetical protein [Aestuariivivens sp. NBU2969]|uniref:hypothetical protein n=1 Tax=Aestuariivivens sp. NBU2969 TaxID=2873267 RepID=UPI001CBE883E|nr:hypothetical protein [Aestuariivivens sp. NBU2969]